MLPSDQTLRRGCGGCAGRLLHAAAHRRGRSGRTHEGPPVIRPIGGRPRREGASRESRGADAPGESGGTGSSGGDSATSGAHHAERQGVTIVSTAIGADEPIVEVRVVHRWEVGARSGRRPLEDARLPRQRKPHDAAPGARHAQLVGRPKRGLRRHHPAGRKRSAVAVQAPCRPSRIGIPGRPAIPVRDARPARLAVDARSDAAPPGAIRRGEPPRAYSGPAPRAGHERQRAAKGSRSPQPRPNARPARRTRRIVG